MADPWDQLPEESTLWYGRFTAYRRMGTERNVLQIYNQWRVKVGRKPAKTSCGDWVRRSVQYKWHERAQAWDVEERRQQDERHKAEVDVLFQHALQATKVAYQKLTKRLEAMAPDELEAKHVIPQFLALLRKMEEQYGRQTATPIQLQIVTDEDRQAIRERIQKQLAQYGPPVDEDSED